LKDKNYSNVDNSCRQWSIANDSASHAV